jgi:iron uptake system component EfeO
VLRTDDATRPRVYARVNRRRYGMRAQALAGVAVVLVLASGCAQSEPEATQEPSPTPASKISVTLTEFEVAATPETGAAGKVTFALANEGDEVHEFVVIRSDLAPGKLPTKADGSVDEDKVNGIDEVEDIEKGATAKLKVDLEAGSYALVCNRVDEEDDGTVEAHYKLGMRTGFTVS